MMNNFSEINQYWRNAVTQRYYRLILQRDLWGEWVLTRAWGRIDGRQGHQQHTPCDSYAHGVVKLKKLKKVRERRGYHLQLSL